MEKEEKVRAKKGAVTAYDVQRSKLDKLMKDPSKPVFIPETRKERDPNKAPDFVYNVMGSSAGAGSGEFHIYRNIRRKEALRQKVLTEQKEKKDLNEAFHLKLEENAKTEEERGAKRRAKNQKRKALKKKQRVNKGKKDESSSDSGSGSDDEQEEKEEK